MGASEVTLKANKIYNLFSVIVFVMVLRLFMTIIMTNSSFFGAFDGLLTRLWGVGCLLSKLI